MPLNEQIAAIIGKKLEGQATTEELEQLQLWLDAAPDNPAAYDQLARIWLEGPRRLPMPAFDVDAAWEKVDRAIRVKPIFFYGRRIAVAAAVIAIIATGWWVLNKRNRWERAEAVAANQSLHLPDGSVVFLRRGSVIEYPRAFDARERTVRLAGEAFFKVQHNEHQPFRITTPHTQVEVLGTSFLVRSEAALDEVVVATGRVSVTDNAQSANHIVLAAGQKAILISDSFRQAPVSDSNYMAWKTGLLNFKGASLAQVIEDVRHYYGVPLEMTGPIDTAKTTGITVRFDNEPFEDVLTELKQVTGLDSKKENGKIYLYQK
jgi:ferric-dicitrate binding protein FerR (iron transport regulator)